MGNNRAEYVPGDIVKLHLTQSGKGGGKNVPVIYGRITGFEIPEGLEAGEVRAFLLNFFFVFLFFSSFLSFLLFCVSFFLIFFTYWHD